MTDISEDLKCIVETLRELKPTGNDGFEGLVGLLLSGFCKTSFRLASSGSQQGQDGQNFDDLLKVSFEAKRYGNTIYKDGVQSKVTEICAQINGPDVWVLAATGPLSTQVRNTVELQLEKEGIAFLCLDWCTPPQLPLWAVLFSHQSDISLNFEAISTLANSEKNRLNKAMEAVRADDRYAESVSKLLRQLTEGSIGADIAIKRNQTWLEARFSNKAEAKAEFGQVLAPNATAAIPLQIRESLIAEIIQSVFETLSESPIFLLGGEGHGKSWSFAQSHVAHENPCLTVILSTSNLAQQHLSANVEDYLIQSLIAQTGDTNTDKTKARWKRRFQAWRNQACPAGPRMVIFVDGINQKPNLPWSRWIEKLTAFSRKIGANLVISSRVHFAEQVIFQRLYTAKKIINVPEWSELELNSILTLLEVDSRDVEPSVFNSLKNPRLLSVAFETLGKNRVRNLSELSSSRLLYEYVFAFGRESDAAITPRDHISSLSDYADIILQRLVSNNLDDLSVFSDDDKAKIESDLDAVSTERFFEPLSGSPDLYRLKDEGLDLAVGIAILNKLKKAQRNKHDVREELYALLDPFSALDRTSDILLGGCVAAVLDQHCHTDVQASLIGMFLNIQNIDESSYQSFQGLVRAAPKAALRALKNSYQDGRNIDHKDWLLSAIKENNSTESVADAVSEYIHSGLRSYTLDPRTSVIAHRGDADRQEKIEQKAVEIKANLDSLTPSEKSFLEHELKEVSNTDLSSLALDCFHLLSGSPLEGYAESLFAWRFGAPINANFRAPTDEFAHLLMFNTKDWTETRVLLLGCIKRFDIDGASDPIRWATRGVLFATGAEEDHDRSVEILNAIRTEDPRNGIGPWRLIESYCDTDPCDPDSAFPSNIEQTLKKFQNLDFSKIRSNVSSTEEDHFFSDSQYGLARFKAPETYEAMEDYVCDVISREGNALKFGIFSIQKKPEILPASLAVQASQKALNLAIGAKPREGDNWVKSQFLLNTAFCHFDGEEQLALIKQLEPSNPIIKSFEHTFKKAPSSKIEASIKSALDNEEREKIINLLSFLRTDPGTPPTGSVELFRLLLAHENSVVKALTLSLLGDGYCDDVLEEFSASNWSVRTPPDRDERLETWYGSRALITAADRGFITYVDAANRISSPLFSSLSSREDLDANRSISEQLDLAIRNAIGFSASTPLPRVGVQVHEGGEKDLNYLSIEPADTEEQASLESFSARLNETVEEFNRKQQEAQQAYTVFRNSITEFDARILLDDIGRRTVRNIFAVDEGLVKSWGDMLLDEHYSNLSGFKNIALYVAEAIAGREPEKAIELFKRSKSLRSFTSFSSGLSKLPLHLSCLWNASDSEELKNYRAECLRVMSNDDELAEAVLAAQLAGKTTELLEFINSEFQINQPTRQARAITLTGFLDESSKADELLSGMSKRRGLPGRAYENARYAYERNIWARHWFKELAASNNQEEFWRHGVLLCKVVDGRIDLWRDEFEFSDVAKKFTHGTTKRVKDRIEKWSRKRNQKLFGQKMPHKIFIY